MCGFAVGRTRLVGAPRVCVPAHLDICWGKRLTWTFVGVKIEFLDICWGKSERISESKGWRNNLLKAAKHDFLLRATQDVEPDFSVRSDLP